MDLRSPIPRADAPSAPPPAEVTPLNSGSCLKSPASMTPAASAHLMDKAYRALIDLLPQPVFFKNRESVLVYANPAMLAELGRKAEDVIGKTDFDLFPKELAERFRA